MTKVSGDKVGNSGRDVPLRSSHDTGHKKPAEASHGKNEHLRKSEQNGVKPHHSASSHKQVEAPPKQPTSGEKNSKSGYLETRLADATMENEK